MTLPQFQEDPQLCIDVARMAEAAGLDGVFAFDHLWPIRRPDRPALHGLSLVAALAVETERLRVGTLVARVGLLPDAVLVDSFATLHLMAGPRLIAGLGLGDRLSRAENEAYGVAFPSVAERRQALVRCCRSLGDLGIETWVGGLGEQTRAVGRAEAHAVNLWGVPPETVAAEAGRGDAVAVTWGGQVDLSVTDAASLLSSLEQTGATWSVIAPLGVPWAEAVETIAEAAQTLSLH